VLEPRRAQIDLRIVLGVQQGATEHVLPRPFLGGVGYIRREIGLIFLSTQRRLIHRQFRHREMHIERRAGQIGRHIKGTVQGVGGNDMIVPRFGQRAATKHQESQQGLLRSDVVRSSLVGLRRWSWRGLARDATLRAGGRIGSVWTRWAPCETYGQHRHHQYR
jgi:hypothetical protein